MMARQNSKVRNSTEIGCRRISSRRDRSARLKRCRRYASEDTLAILVSDNTFLHDKAFCTNVPAIIVWQCLLCKFQLQERHF